MTTQPDGVWNPELILARYSLRQATLDERFHAAAAAGFPAIGLAVVDYENLLNEGGELQHLKERVDAHGLRVEELETILAWDVPPADRPELAVRREALALQMARVFDIGHVVVYGDMQGGHGSDPIGGFAALCDRAAEVGLGVALEPVPSTSVSDLSTALRIVESAARSNGGLNIDIWHATKGGWLDDLRGLDPALVGVVQVNDGIVAPSGKPYLEDAQFRVPPGEGEFDLPAFFRALDDAKVRAPVSVEVITADGTAPEPPGPGAERLMAGTVVALRAAGIETSSK